MKESARSIGSHARIVDGFVIRRGLHVKVSRRRKGIGKSRLCIDVEDAGRNLVAAAIASAIENKFAVAADVFKGHAGGMVWGPGKRIDEQLIEAVRGAADVELEKVLAAGPFAEKIAAAALHGCFKRIRVEELREASRELDAAGEFGKRGLGARLFGGDPGASLRSVLIFEPAIRIGNDRAAVGVLRGIDTRRGRTFCGRRGVLALCGREASRGQARDKEQRSSEHAAWYIHASSMKG